MAGGDTDSSGASRDRAIGVDLGLVRVGVSISDDLGLMAHPLCVLAYAGQNRLVENLESLAESNGAGTFVIGVPKNMDGTAGEGARRAVRFAKRLARKTGLEVVLCDERLTTSQAEKEMIALGKSRRRRRLAIDEAAAVLILENYLRQKRLASLSEGQ